MRQLYKWDYRFTYMARNEVATWSKDPDKQVGCVIVSPDRRRLTCGYNGLPVNMEDTAERLGDKDLKNRLSVHAELNAILNARTDLTGWTLYVTEAPCLECAKVIMQAGIVRVVSPTIDRHSSWAAGQLMAAGVLREAGITQMTIDEEDTA